MLGYGTTVLFERASAPGLELLEPKIKQAQHGVVHLGPIEDFVNPKARTHSMVQNIHVPDGESITPSRIEIELQAPPLGKPEREVITQDKCHHSVAVDLPKHCRKKISIYSLLISRPGV